MLLQGEELRLRSERTHCKPGSQPSVYQDLLCILLEKQLLQQSSAQLPTVHLRCSRLPPFTGSVGTHIP